MSRLSRILALLLIGTMAAALPGVQALAISAASPQSSPPAACHSHHPAAPSKAPAGFQCCVNGHHAALPSASFSPGPLDAQASALNDARVFPASAYDPLCLAMAVGSDRPPSAVPLRI